MKRMRKAAMAAAAFTAFALLLAGCNFSFSSAKVENACMATALDEDGKPADSVQSFPADAGTIYAAAELRNAPDNTQVRIVWTYETTGEKMGETTVDSGEITNNNLYSSFTPDGVLPEGDYKVEFFVDDREEPDATARFSVTAAESPVAEGAYIKDAHMTSGMDADGRPMDTIDTVDTQGTWFVCATLMNTQPDTAVRFVWYTPEGDAIAQFDLDPKGQDGVYISCSLQLTEAAPEGVYMVGIFLDGGEEPAATVEFTVKAGGQ